MKDVNIDLGGKGRLEAWNRFWFTPASPKLLGLMRICCGLVTFYTLFIYSFRLQEFMGQDAWLDLDARLQEVHKTPRPVDSLHWPVDPSKPLSAPKSKEEEAYNLAYFRKWGQYPPPPYPASRKAQDYVDAYRGLFGFDVRANGIRAPENEDEFNYVLKYTEDWGRPPPAYVTSDAEYAEVEEYLHTYGYDPRSLYAYGTPIWSLWFDVTDPAAMAIAHGVVVLIAFLFTIGFCTRITSALTWMFSLWYIHRSPVTLFGVDTMQTILLLYLMIGPSGAALSVDRLIARWWSKNKLRVVNRWRGLWGKPALSAEQIVPAVYSPTPQPSVSANVAYRLTQIHVCIIYLIAGLAKLQGSAWWKGEAVWGTLANFEFAPMQFDAYLWVLRKIVEVHWIGQIFLTSAAIFTIAFEIGYAFLIWRPATRWWILAGAILLHGFIGLFMGLKTFSLMMLVMNMAFLKESEAKWIIRFFADEPKDDTRAKTPSSAPPEAPIDAAPKAATAAPHTAIKEAGAKVKRK